MLLIMINGVTLLNTSYYVAFAFIFKETYEIYKWLVECVKNFYKYLDILNLNVILTNIQNNLI